MNSYLYGLANPINYTDPSGYITKKESKRAKLILEKLDAIYDVQIKKDWGYLNEFIDTDNIYIDASMGCEWIEGNWRSLHEFELTLQAIKDMAKVFGPQKGLFNTAMRWQPVRIYRIPTKYIFGHGAMSINNVILPNDVFSTTDEWAKGQVVHELAHVMDYRQWWPPFRLSNDMARLTKSFTKVCVNGPIGIQSCSLVYDPMGQNEAPPSVYAQGNPREDWAESFKYFVYPSFGNLGPIRRDYIRDVIWDLKTP